MRKAFKKGYSVCLMPGIKGYSVTLKFHESDAKKWFRAKKSDAMAAFKMICAYLRIKTA